MTTHGHPYYPWISLFPALFPHLLVAGLWTWHDREHVSWNHHGLRMSPNLSYIIVRPIPKSTGIRWSGDNINGFCDSSDMVVSAAFQSWETCGARYSFGSIFSAWGQRKDSEQTMLSGSTTSAQAIPVHPSTTHKLIMTSNRSLQQLMTHQIREKNSQTRRFKETGRPRQEAHWICSLWGPSWHVWMGRGNRSHRAVDRCDDRRTEAEILSG